MHPSLNPMATAALSSSIRGAIGGSSFVPYFGLTSSPLGFSVPDTMIAAPSLASPKFLSASMAPQRRPRILSRAPQFQAVHSSADTALPSRATAAAPPASLYDVLGLAPGATSQEIKSAFRRLARTCHPDVAAGAGRKGNAADEFMRVHAAYATLSDPNKRAEYDREEMMKMVGLQRRQSWSMASSSSFYRSSQYGRRSWETDQCW